MTMSYATPWRRLLARLTDLLLLAVVVCGLVFLVHIADADEPLLTDALLFGCVFVWELLIPIAAHGMTVGKWMLGLRVVREDQAGPVSAWQLAGRLICRICLFSLFAVFIAYELEFPVFVMLLAVEGIAASCNKRRQTLADLVARTVVVRFREDQTAPL